MPRLASRIAQRLGSIKSGTLAGDALEAILRLDREHHQTEHLCAQIKHLETHIPMECPLCPHTPSA